MIRYRWLERRIRRTVRLLLSGDTRGPMAQFLLYHSAGATLWYLRGRFRFLLRSGALR